MILRSPTDHENGRISLHAKVNVRRRGFAIGSLRHAGMDCRHPGPQDASGHIHISLGSGQSMPERRVRIVILTQLAQSDGNHPTPAKFSTKSGRRQK